MDPTATRPRAATPALRWSPAWALEPDGDSTTLVLSAGGDRRVAIDGVAAGDRAAVERWARRGAVATAPWPGTPRARLLDRLVELGAAVPDLPPMPPTVVAGDERLSADLAALLDAAAPEVAVIVRTGAGWPGVPPGAPHLGVDLALHHTVVVGPFVLPGVSACLACLDARTAHRWGRPVVPDRPAVQRRLPVVAALVDVQLGLIAAGTSPLVNATTAWNLETGTVDRQALYKLVGCPACATGETAPASCPPRPSPGRVALPWVAA